VGALSAPAFASAKVTLITDRALVDGGAAALPARIAALLAAVPRGSTAIQIREKDLDGGPLLALTRAVLAVAHPAGAPVYVNDRVDIAIAAGADGVHLPEGGLSIAAARALASSSRPRFIVGCSRHSAADARAAATAGVDVIQLGPYYAVANKAAALGPAAFAVRGDLPDHVRLTAVGGIDSPERVAAAHAAGADAVAVIRAAWQSPETAPARIAAIVQSLK
jgi:thiamine-phosphate pyrophosphorylase